ncbi:MAG: excinuclease subunit [Thermoleophilia bacterium]|nr:excinuclease subunit [Thermoleophilia bacterium]
MDEPTPSNSPVRDGLIRVRGARVHNLREVDVDVPREAVTCFTGVSGSGKSSLAFDTIHADAQRRFLEGVAPYARRLVQQASSPRVGSITGLPPTVALEQRRSTPGRRSTLGTITTISNSLRMLLSRAGTYPAGVSERLDSDAFSPNTAAGACATCHGLGVVHEATERSMVPDPSLSIREGAVASWPGAWLGKSLRDILTVLGHDVDVPWRELPAETREWILFTDEQPVVTVHAEREAHRIQRPYQGTFQSARRHVLRTLGSSQSAQQRRRALRFVETRACETCGGAGIRADALTVTFLGRSIGELGAMELGELVALLEPVAAVGDVEADVAAALCRDIVDHARPITELGLGYLSVDRPAPTLSAGELQRVRLATLLRGGLFGVAYVLDEPSAGLHPADAAPMHDLLGQLRATGNTVLVVEHDLALVERADWVVEVGPGAGERGGEVLYAGPPTGLSGVSASVTRRYLPSVREPVASSGRTAGRWLELSGVELHNLRGVDVRVPVGCFTAVSGVSGSGKSSLVTGAIVAAAREQLGLEEPVADADGGSDDPALDATARGDRPRWRVAAGFDVLDRLVSVDQRPIGRTPRSNLATYTGLFDAVRKLFAATPLAIERGYGVGRFSFNVDGGRCPTCQGEGAVSVELMFLPGTYATCETCGGSRYEPETLEVTWSGLTIADVLALSVEAALDTFTDERPILRSLVALDEVGLGYLRLGQPATELSGGEAQRIKLATELQRARRGHALYVLDEPTTGLHPADVELLVAQLHRLVDAGNTVIVVEHDMSVVAGADHVIDIGPGGGADGGSIVATGTPAEVAGARASRTAPWLAPFVVAP